jgi:hypothetical protein
MSDDDDSQRVYAIEALQALFDDDTSGADLVVDKSSEPFRVSVTIPLLDDDDDEVIEAVVAADGPRRYEVVVLDPRACLPGGSKSGGVGDGGVDGVGAGNSSGNGSSSATGQTTTPSTATASRQPATSNDATRSVSVRTLSPLRLTVELDRGYPHGGSIGGGDKDTTAAIRRRVRLNALWLDARAQPGDRDLRELVMQQLERVWRECSEDGSDPLFQCINFLQTECRDALFPPPPPAVVRGGGGGEGGGQGRRGSGDHAQAPVRLEFRPVLNVRPSTGGGAERQQEGAGNGGGGGGAVGGGGGGGIDGGGGSPTTPPSPSSPASSSSSSMSYLELLGRLDRLADWDQSVMLERWESADHTCELCDTDGVAGSAMARLACRHAFCLKCLGHMCTVHIGEGQVGGCVREGESEGEGEGEGEDEGE